MAKILLDFDPHNMVDLLTHYTNGKIPLGAEMLAIGPHVILQRELGMVLESDQWDDPLLPNQEALAPLYVNYEGRKVMVWGTRDNSDITWQEGPGS